MALITPQLTYDGFEQVDIIVEAVLKAWRWKRDLRALDKIAKPDCVLASHFNQHRRNRVGTTRPQMGSATISSARERNAIARNRARREDFEGRQMRPMALAKKLNKVVSCRQLPRIHRQSMIQLGYAAKPSSVAGAAQSTRDIRLRFGMDRWRWATRGPDVGRIRKEFKHLEKPAFVSNVRRVSEMAASARNGKDITRTMRIASRARS